MSDGRANRGHLSLLDTNFTLNVYGDPSQSPRLPPSNAISIEQLSPTPRTPLTPFNIDPPIPNVNSRARNESRKLLSHVLLQLADRKKPEPIIDSIASVTHNSADDGLGALSESLRDAFRMGSRQEARSERRSAVSQDDSDDENADVFTTDETYDLMLQLLNVLTMSVAQGWHIFNERFVPHGIYLLHSKMAVVLICRSPMRKVKGIQKPLHLFADRDRLVSVRDLHLQLQGVLQFPVYFPYASQSSNPLFLRIVVIV